MSAVVEAREAATAYFASVVPKRVFALLATAQAAIPLLRELILGMAVRGQLVPQDDAEGHAASALSAAQQAKAAAVLGRRAKRTTEPLGGAADGESFELPTSWLWVGGADLFKVVRGVSYEKQQASDVSSPETVSLLRANNIQRTLNFDDSVYVPADLVGDEQWLRMGDHVVCMASGSKGLVGKAAPFVGGPVCTFGAFCAAIRSYESGLSPYLGVFLSSPLYRREVSAQSAGIGINNLKSSTLLSLRLPLPPLAEQRRIVTRVEELMRLCDAMETSDRLADEQHARLTSTLFDALAGSESAHVLAENWKRVAGHFSLLLDRPEAIDAFEAAISHMAVRGLLVPQESCDEPTAELLVRLRADRMHWLLSMSESDAECRTALRKLAELPPPGIPFQIPSSWQFVRLLDCTRLLVDCHNKTAPYAASGVPLIRTTNVRNGQFKFDDPRFVAPETYQYWSRRCPPEPGDIIFTREAPMGEAAIIPEDAVYCLGQRTMLVRPMRPFVDVDYLLLALTEPHLLARAAPAAIGSTVKHLRVGDVERLTIPLPPIHEQHRIVARVEELRRLCADLRQRLKQAQVVQSRLAEALVAEVT